MINSIQNDLTFKTAREMSAHFKQTINNNKSNAPFPTPTHDTKKERKKEWQYKTVQQLYAKRRKKDRNTFRVASLQALHLPNLSHWMQRLLHNTRSTSRCQ